VPVRTYNVCMGKRPTKPDQHKNQNMSLRLPPHLAEWLKQIAQSEDRTYTAVVMRALRTYAEKNGYEWPKTPPGEPAD
jgi:hypothetical protein